ncbi:hypothetical protein [Anabaena sp. CCY 9402-a]|uniref:hypothetical protein n=1 Tax=Anabaena sp. CCY 9402-a TaxID=3103867 RepID=UPI0039C6E63C
MVRKIILHTLRCDKTEYYFGGDKTLLEVFTDGKQRVQLRNNMKQGDTWLLGKSYEFNHNATVKLWDEDNPSFLDIYDLIGELKVGSFNINLGTARFAKAAYYTLTYSVTTSPSSQTVPNPPSHPTIEIFDVLIFSPL